MSDRTQDYLILAVSLTYIVAVLALVAHAHWWLAPLVGLVPPAALLTVSITFELLDEHVR